MKIGDELKLHGVTYLAVDDPNQSCDGCAADDAGEVISDALCCYDCYDGRYKWAKIGNPCVEIPVSTGFNGTTASDIPKPKDHINPDHYKVGGIETIDYLKAKLTPEEFKGYLHGNALKYLSRSGHKHESPVEDFKKALWYINKYLEVTIGSPGKA